MPANVLIVEDDEILALMLRYNLESAGYRVEVCTRGDAADARLMDTPPDLVVLDWMLPGLSGVEICRRLRKRDLPHRPSVIMLTARSDRHDIEWALQAGADGYIVKPFSLRDLLAKICAMLAANACAAAPSPGTPAPASQLVD